MSTGDPEEPDKAAEPLADGEEGQPTQYTYLTWHEVLALYGEMMELGGADPISFVRDMGLLESTLARAENAAYYEAADLVRQAASLLWGMVKNHPFIDGNKRIAHLTGMTFLDLNGRTITATEDEEFQLMLDIADCMELDRVERWLREHLST